MKQKPLRIGLLYTGGRSWIGGETYILNTLEALRCYRKSQDVDVDFRIILCFDDKSIADHVQATFKEADEIQYLETSSNRLRKRDQALSIINLYIPRRFRFFQPRQKQETYKADGIDLLYPYFFDKQIPGGVHGLGWIPDFQPRLMPEYFPADNLRDRFMIEERIINSAKHIVFSSNDSIEQFRKLFPGSPAKAHLFHFHASVDQSAWINNPIDVQSKYNLPDKFFICCNQFWRHKNHRLLIAAIAKLIAHQPEIFVVFTGHTHDYRSPGYFDDLCAEISTLSIRGNIAILGLIPKSDQLQLIRRSIGVIQPSLSEGWSTVVEDVRALSKPSILSNLPVHHEQNPDQALFLTTPIKNH